MVPARSCLRFLPPPPPTTNAAQPEVAAVFFPAPGSSPSEDRISQLPEDIQRTIVSKLPVKDGGATVVLSSSWRSIWSSIPLVLDDAQLWPAGADELVDDDEDMEAIEYLSRDVVWGKVTAILRSHPGPFRSVRLTSSPASSLRTWLRIMAAKGVEELVVLNCEWPTAMMVLSVELLRCESLKRLHLALSQMPHLTVPGRAGRPAHRRAVHFPNLEELVLCHAFVPETDIGDFLAGCPVLKMLAFIEGCGVPPYIDVLCPRLKCLLLWQFKPLKLTVDAPRIERVILWRTNQFFIPPQTRILIRRAPNLRILGYLDPKLHVLESGDMVIKVRHIS
jgi:hypothetical protein